jgi:transposase
MQARHDWLTRRLPAMQRQPERLVFIDERSIKTNLTRLRGRAPCGVRLAMDAPFGHWNSRTFIAGLTPDGLIAPWVIKGAMDGPAFAASVERVPVPELMPGTVVILDNLATHRNVEAATPIRQAGCCFLCLPPYSPDLNPIKQAFSKLKAQRASAQGRRTHLCRTVQRTPRHLSNVHARGMLELLSGRWVWRRSIPKGFRRQTHWRLSPDEYAADKLRPCNVKTSALSSPRVSAVRTCRR